VSLLGERPGAAVHAESGGPDVDPLLDLAGPVGRPVDWLAARTGLSVSELLARVALLELDGLVRLESDLVVAAPAGRPRG
jgi:predicted Rossmann fold nucleotide-binding protein DprA/Smf involved in DNA uptake